MIECIEETKQTFNNSDESDCDSIPEEFNHSPTAPHSPTDTNRGTEVNIDTVLTINGNGQNQSQRTSENFSSKDDTYMKTRSTQERPIGDALKKMMKNCASTANLEKATPSFHNLNNESEKLNVSVQATEKHVNNLKFKSNQKHHSPYRFYQGLSNKSPVRPNKNQLSGKKG